MQLLCHADYNLAVYSVDDRYYTSLHNLDGSILVFGRTAVAYKTIMFKELVSPLYIQLHYTFLAWFHS